MSIKIRSKLCHKHPYYQAIRKPRVNCLRCWTAYYEAHGLSTSQASNTAKLIVTKKESLINK